MSSNAASTGCGAAVTGKGSAAAIDGLQYKAAEDDTLSTPPVLALHATPQRQPNGN